jgi:hypothetical protein
MSGSVHLTSGSGWAKTTVGTASSELGMLHFAFTFDSVVNWYRVPVVIGEIHKLSSKKGDSAIFYTSKNNLMFKGTVS